MRNRTSRNVLMITASRSITLGLKLTLQFSQNQSNPTFADHDLKFVAFNPTHPGWNTLPHDPLHKTLLSDRAKFLEQALHVSILPRSHSKPQVNNPEGDFPTTKTVPEVLWRRRRNTNTLKRLPNTQRVPNFCLYRFALLMYCPLKPVPKRSSVSIIVFRLLRPPNAPRPASLSDTSTALLKRVDAQSNTNRR